AADGLELERLLDRYVALALAQARCARALDRADLPGLEEKVELARTEGAKELRLLEHRLAHAPAIEDRARELADTMRALAELVRHHAERVAAPEREATDDLEVIAMALDRFDAYDAVTQELTQGASHGE